MNERKNAGARIAIWSFISIAPFFGLWTYLRSVQSDIVSAVSAYNAAWTRNALAAGVSPNTCDKNGRPVIIIALKNKDAGCVTALLEAGANVDVQDSDGSTAADLAFRTYVPSIMKKIFARTTPGSARSEACNAGLWFAATTGDIELAKELLRLGADVNSRSNGSVPKNTTQQAKHGETPLLRASSNGKAKMVQFLLSNGADINALNEGRSALMLAAMYRHPEVVQVLIAHGARSDLRDPYFKMNALELARSRKFGAQDQDNIRMLARGR